MATGKTISIHLGAEDYTDFARKVSKDHPGLTDGAAAKQVLLRWLEQGALGDMRIDSSKIDSMANEVTEILKVQSEMRAKQNTELAEIKKVLAAIHKKIPVTNIPMQSRGYQDDQGVKGLTLALNGLIEKLSDI